jgi:anti-anti-sigma factor
MDPRFSIHHGERTISICGELDIATVPYFRAAVVEHDGELVEIDLDRLLFVDSTGLRALLEARLRHPGLHYINPPRQLQQLGEMTGTSVLLFAHVA